MYYLLAAVDLQSLVAFRHQAGQGLYNDYDGGQIPEGVAKRGVAQAQRK